MTNRLGSLSEEDEAAFSKAQDLFLQERHHECLVFTGRLLTRAKETEQTGFHRVLAELIQQCARELTSTSEAPKLELKCSFCGETPPRVRLGAGPSVFICNECVSIFSEVLSQA